MRVILVIISLFLVAHSRPKVNWQSLETRIDNSLNSTKKNSIWVERVDTTYPCYVVGVFKTIPYRYEDAGAVLLNFERYPEIFNHFVATYTLKNPCSRRDKSLYYYLEGKTLWLGGWGIGKVTELRYDTTIYLKVEPISKCFLNHYRKKIYRNNKKLFYIKSLNLEARLIKIDENSSRVAIVAWSQTSKPMPMVIVDIVLSLAVPSFINDLEKFTKKLHNGKVALERDREVLLNKFIKSKPIIKNRK